MKGKKGFQVGDLMPLAIAFVVIAIAIGLGATVLDDIQVDQCNDVGWYNASSGACCTSSSDCENLTSSIAYNSSGSGLDAVDTFGGWLPTVALVVIAAVIIGIIVTYLARKHM